MIANISDLPQMVIKRNGESQKFDAYKIKHAIERAMEAVNQYNTRLLDQLLDDVLGAITLHESTPTVEQIQDEVEKALFKQAPYEVSKAFVVYRHQHKELRSTKSLFSNIELIDDYLQLKDWRVKESANSNYSLQGLHQHVATVLSSEYWLDKIYAPEVADAHRNGRIHVHDLGFLSVYCVGWDLQDLLLEGFTGVEGKVCSQAPKHFSTALGQTVNFFYTMQGEAAGAQAFSNFDTLLAPFIRHDNLNRDQVKQCLQEFMFNMNVPTRVGFQTPFTNVTLDLVVPGHLKDEAVVIGGERLESTYGDYQAEMDMFNDVFAEIMLEGDAKGRVFSFPIPTYNITKDFNWDNPAWSNIWKCTARYGIPYFSNFVNSDMSPDDVRSMCCRLRLDNRELKKRGGGLFGANPLTGSIGVVTINLAQLGFKAESEEDFFSRLGKLMDLSRDSLETKRKVIERFTEQGLYPYSKHYLRHLYQANGAYWNNHFSTIGIIGMNEACLNLKGEGITDPDSYSFSLKVMNYMRNRLAVYQETTGHIYNLEATPAEGASYRLARIDTQKYPSIQVANREAYEAGLDPYYTNSTHLPVNYTDDLYEALRLQDPLQSLYTGGTVFHTFLGESQLTEDAVKLVVRKVTNNFKLPYFTLTPTFSVCPEHGYLHGEHEICPKCRKEEKITRCEVYSRIVGYLRPVQQWNDGKAQEFEDRYLLDKAIMHDVEHQAEDAEEFLPH